MPYKPPFEITNKILNLSNEINELVGSLKSINNLERMPSLRKVSRIKNIYSSLKIENNTLSLNEMTCVLNGVHVIGNESDIKAVKNASKAYDIIESIDYKSIDDLLKVQGIMMNDLAEEQGQFRIKQVGVFNSNHECIHLGPTYDLVPELMNNLFDFLINDETSLLIKSCVFHYELEYIHPFNDGNGRMGRLWQTVILSSWRKIFLWTPIESFVKEHQSEYYKVIHDCDLLGNSTLFIEFMLEIIKKSLEKISNDSYKYLSHISDYVNELMKVIDYIPQSANELMSKLNLKSKDNFRNNYLKPAIEAGLIIPTELDKNKSKNQKYIKL